MAMLNNQRVNEYVSQVSKRVPCLADEEILQTLLVAIREDVWLGGPTYSGEFQIVCAETILDGDFAL